MKVADFAADMEKRNIFQYIKPYYGAMAFGLFIKILGTFADLGLPRVLAYILDHVVPKDDIRLVFFWGGIMVLLAVAARSFNVIANCKAAKVAADVTQSVRHDMYKKINRLSGRQVDQLTVPSLISRMTSDSYNIHKIIGMLQRAGVRGPIILLGGVVITATMDPVLTLVLLVLIPLIALIVFGVSRKTVPMYKNVQKKVDNMVDVLRENITGIRVIKALSKTEHERRRFRAVNDELIDAELTAAYTMAASSPLMHFVLNLGLVGVVVIGAWRVNSGTIEPGTIIAFLSYFTMILNSIMMINRVFIQLNQATASADRIMEVLNAPDEPVIYQQEETGNTAPDGSLISYEKKAGAPFISFKNVSFRYNETGELCLNNISFTLNKGESLGIIGATGCGKTTIINLLMRFYDVTKGSICVEGQDIRTMSLKDLRSRFGVAFQNDIVFADSIYENISFCREIPLLRAKEAAEDACAAAFIEELGLGTDEEKYDYKAAIKGANLSGGQKQRLLIARAFANNPEILVLDDSSSALDYKTDARLRKALKEHYDDATVIMVAQRVSSIMQCDKILVMDEGEIIGAGSHEQLLSSCEIYREIQKMQMEA